MEKVKTISKYVVNFLQMINALLIGLAPIWGWHVDKITDTIIVVAGIISAYLILGKLFRTSDKDFKGKEE